MEPYIGQIVNVGHVAFDKETTGTIIEIKGAVKVLIRNNEGEGWANYYRTKKIVENSILPYGQYWCYPSEE